jgi:single-strand DNA-binding protein
MSTNMVVLRGNLTRDVEVKQTGAGMKIAVFTLAVNERSKDKVQGTVKSVGHFFDCKAFGTTAETAAKYLSKGANLVVTGKLSQDTWEAKDGAKRSKVVILVNAMDFVKRAEGEAQAARPESGTGDHPPAEDATAVFDDSEQLPF